MDFNDVLAQAASQPPADNTARAAFDALTAHLPDVPEFETLTPEEQDRIKRSPQVFTDAESFVTVMEYLDATEEHGTRPNDIYLPLYPDDPAQRGFDLDPDYQSEMDRLLNDIDARSLPAYGVPIMERWIQLLPLWGARLGLTKPVADHTAEFIWAPIRMLLAGAGYTHWEALATACCAYPSCPFDPTESRSTWDRNTLKAHKNCGWPAQLIFVQYADLRRVFWEETAAKARPAPQWLGALATLHWLKHTRRDPDGRFRVLHRGVACVVELDRRFTTIAANNNTIVSAMIDALGMVAAAKNRIRADAVALRTAAKTLNYDALLATLPLSELPSCVFAGIWTTLIPSMGDPGGFVDHRLCLQDAKLAQEGKIIPYRSEDEDVISWAWRVGEAGSDEVRAAKSSGFDVLPDTYDVGLPMDLFMQAFPNLSPPDHVDLDAYLALLEAPIFASLMRSETPALDYEFPLVVGLPSMPTSEGSTNTGKTSAVDCYAGAMVPGLHAVGIPDSSSAPDTRAVAASIRDNGTVAVDEFIMPRSTVHPLNKTHLQTLCTGRAVASGRVLRDSGSIRLHHSIVMSAKFLDAPPDIINRSVFFWLRDLTEDERADWRTFERIQSGTLALEMRLGALAYTQAKEFREYFAAIPRKASRTNRFGGHRALAALIYALRTGVEDVEAATAALDKAHAFMGTRFNDHCATADETGLVDEVATGRVRPLRLSMLVEECREGDLNVIRAYTDQHMNAGTFSAIVFLRGMADAHQADTQHVANWVQETVGGPGTGGRWTERKLGRALMEGLRASASTDGVVGLPSPFANSGWALTISGERHNRLRWLQLAAPK